MDFGLGFERGETSAHRRLGTRQFDSRQLKLQEKTRYLMAEGEVTETGSFPTLDVGISY